MARKCFDKWTDADIRRITGKESSDLVSAEDLKDSIDSATRNRNNTYRQAAVMSVANTAMNRVDTGARGLMSLLSRDWTETSRFLSADQRISAIRSMSKAGISDLMNAMSPKFRQTFAGIATGKRKLTTDQQKIIGDTIREIFGEQTGNADGLKAAKAWNKMNDGLIDRFGDAGGDIRIRKNWRLPQKHDRERIRKVSSEQWVDRIWHKLDHRAMKAIMWTEDADNTDLREALHSSYYNILNGDLNMSTKTRMKDRMANNRFLQFKNADSWLKYQEEFGEPNIYASMLSHIDVMSRDIGMMETFGPDPDAGFASLKQRAITRDRNERPDANVGTNSRRAQETYDLLASIGGVSTAEQGRFATGTANALASIRNLRVSSKLGGAVMASASDVVFAGQTAFYNGLPVIKTLKGMYREVAKSHKNPESMKRQMHDMGFGADYAIDRAFLSYDQMQTSGSTNTRFAAEAVMQASGMNHLTHSTRAGFQYEFTAGISRAANLDYKKLSSKMRKALSRYGIDSEAWNGIRSAERMSFKGEKLLDPRRMSVELQTKYIGMVDAETNMAVPMPDIRVRSRMTFGHDQGTVYGELSRGVTQFHSFNVTMLMNNMTRMVAGKSFKGNADRFAQMASMITVGTILGAVVIQSREVMNGKTPMDWDSGKLWMRAVNQSGLTSYLGDFYAKEAMGWRSTTVAGYIGGAPVAYAELMLKMMHAGDDNAKRLKLMADFTTSEIPFQNLWYSKLATDRILLDRIRRQADENYDKNAERKMRKMEKSTGQKYWWSPPAGEQ